MLRLRLSPGAAECTATVKVHAWTNSFDTADLKDAKALLDELS
jgi:hypothetical protein